MINHDQNFQGGAELSTFYNENRILNMDPFFVGFTIPYTSSPPNKNDCR
ncbi:hypothetical protein [Nonomuraea sp. NPDC050786]